MVVLYLLLPSICMVSLLYSCHRYESFQSTEVYQLGTKSLQSYVVIYVLAAIFHAFLAFLTSFPHKAR